MKAFWQISTFFFLNIIGLSFAQGKEIKPPDNPPKSGKINRIPVKVELVQTDSGFQLLRNNAPYYVNGAGGSSHQTLLKEIGGNSIRTWSIENAEQILDEAEKNGLTVMLGLWVGHERHGFDYNNSTKVKNQLEHFKKVVLQFKDHPALLMWGIGNEVDLFYTNPKVWSAIEDIAKFIHEVDPNHPTSTVTAGLDSNEVQWIKKLAPNIDIYCVNTYGDIANVPKNIYKFGWHGPYMITEWGPNGHWESPVVDGLTIEQTSTQKANSYQTRYQQFIAPNKNYCLGSYVFLWGQKQEFTETWYGLFSKNEQPTEAIDYLKIAWTNKPPQTSTPSVKQLSINDENELISVPIKPEQKAYQLNPNKWYSAKLLAQLIQYPINNGFQFTPNDTQNIIFKWRLLRESNDKKAGGDAEMEASEVLVPIRKKHTANIEFKTPKQLGDYRLFVTIEYKNKVAYANIPFHVSGDIQQPYLSLKSYDSIPKSEYPVAVAQTQTVVQVQIPQTEEMRIQKFLPLQENPSFKTLPVPSLKSFTVSGYYRFITNYRHLNEGYADQMKTPNNLFVGDDSQIPQLLLNLGGSTHSNTRFSTDLYLWSPMTGAGEAENVKGLNLGVSLTGTHDFETGTLNLLTGGINWYSLSPFTFATNPGFNRYSIFERNPWDPQTKNIADRYQQFYNNGALNQDLRWGRQAFQGVIAEFNRMPGKLDYVIMMGKTQLNGGYAPLPNQSLGGKIKKYLGSNSWISANTFNNLTYTDSLQNQSIGFNIHTLEYYFNIHNIILKGELGGGQFNGTEKKQGYGEAIDFKLDLSNKLPFGLLVRYYRISPKVINNSSVFWNSSIREGNNQVKGSNDQQVLVPFSSAMVQVGQITNNRTGIELNSEFKIGKFKNSIGYTASQEINNISTIITYTHPANNLALSRFWRWGFPANVGPYQNLTKVYRSVFETLEITDVNGAGIPTHKKHFNNIEVNSKYKSKLARKDLYVNYLGSYGSVQNFQSPITVFTEKAYIRTYYHQLESYWRIGDRWVWTNYIGWERIIANYSTKTDAISRRPKNQENWGFATGLDIEMSKGAGLYIRQRWMNYADRSFSRDKYKGWETTVEIKIYF